MYARASLMLALQRRTNNKYVMVLDNFDTATQDIIHPDEFIKDNCLMLILMEGKIHATTFFGQTRELIHGIHLQPISELTRWFRNPDFSKLEWTRYFDDKRRWGEDFVVAWRAITLMNKAIFDPVPVWKAMSEWTSENTEEATAKVKERIFHSIYDKDHGESMIWYLTCIASWGGDSGTVVGTKRNGGGKGRKFLTPFFDGTKMI